LSQPTALLVAGRSLLNYAKYGDQVPVECHVERCLGCNTFVAITPEGLRRLLKGRADGNQPAGVICATCALSLSIPIDSVEVTQHAEKQAESNCGIREAIDFMRSKVRKP
jgi:hypothetical protein